MIILRKGKQVCRCDSCDKAPENLDQFDAFYISWPCGTHPVTGENTIKYLMFKHHPGVPETLHTCPWCAKIIRKCLKTNKLHELPDGPLKGWLLAIVAKGENKFRAFQIHYLKESRLGNA